MSVILCRQEQVTHPFYIESLGIHIYSSQELCYVIYNHPLLFMDGFVNEELISFIREELGMGFLSLRMERWLKSGENSDELLFLFLQECDYYSASELNKLRQTIVSYRKLPPLEYAKRKNDYLVNFKQYGKAVCGYLEILDAADKTTEDQFLGSVWANLGVCYARIFQFAKAMDAFDHAYGKKKDIKLLEKMYHLTKLSSDLKMKERYRSAVTEELKSQWDHDYTETLEAADHSEKVEKLKALFEKDPIRRSEGITEMVESWKEEYRSMA